jgi:C-terminal processing protease CtpA/Prc
MRLAVISCLLWLFAVPAAAQRLTTCSTPGKNRFVQGVMRDLYLWYREVPNVSPGRFSSPEAYLDAVRYRALDSNYSYVADRAATEALFSSSQYAGFGFASLGTADGRLRISQVFPNSPAADAGLQRGDAIQEVNGRAIADWIQSGEIGSAYGPAQAGVPGTLVVRRGEQVLRVELVKRDVIIPTVSTTRVFDVGGRRVGYLFFRNFVEPSFEALAGAFAALAAAHVNEVVLDLRYNGGGLVEVARYLAGLVGGRRTEGQVFAEYAHNDRHVSRNETLRFEAQTGGLMLDRLVVITTRASASASELVINGLRPFIPVVIVGDRTYGKPVGQYTLPFCDKILAPVSFVLRNANGEGDYFDGLPADCPAADDLDVELGDPLEGSLNEALTVIATGACTPAPPEPRRARPQSTRPAIRATGWDAILGAH